MDIVSFPFNMPCSNALPCFRGGAGTVQWWGLTHLPPLCTEFNSQTWGFICGLSSLLVLVLALRGFALDTLVFPSPQKPTFPNSNLIWVMVAYVLYHKPLAREIVQARCVFHPHKSPLFNIQIGMLTALFNLWLLLLVFIKIFTLDWLTAFLTDWLTDLLIARILYSGLFEFVSLNCCNIRLCGINF